MELPTGDWCYMPFRVHHILNVHISTYCCFELLTIAGVNSSLIVCAAAQKHTSVSVWRKTKWPNRMAIEWPELFVRSQSFIHCRHVPNFDDVISTTSSYHLGPSMLVKSHRCNWFPMRRGLRKLNLMRKWNFSIVLSHHFFGFWLKKFHSWANLFFFRGFLGISLTSRWR